MISCCTNIKYPLWWLRGCEGCGAQGCPISVNSLDVDTRCCWGVDLNTDQLNCWKFHSGLLVVTDVSHGPLNRGVVCVVRLSWVCGNACNAITGLSMISNFMICLVPRLTFCCLTSKAKHHPFKRSTPRAVPWEKLSNSLVSVWGGKSFAWIVIVFCARDTVSSMLWISSVASHLHRKSQHVNPSSKDHLKM